MNLHQLVKKYRQKSHYKRSKQDHKNVYFAAFEKNPDSYFCMVIFTYVLHIKLSPYKQRNCVCVHSPVHEKVIFCQFLTFFEALKGVGLALHKFEDGIRTFEHKEMGCRGKNGEIGQFLAVLVFWLSCKISFFTIYNHTNGAAVMQNHRVVVNCIFRKWCLVQSTNLNAEKPSKLVKC